MIQDNINGWTCVFLNPVPIVSVVFQELIAESIIVNIVIGYFSGSPCWDTKFGFINWIELSFFPCGFLVVLVLGFTRLGG
jgi:hypothetical protein